MYRFGLVLAVLMAFSLSGLAEETIRFGAIYPLTGPIADTGQRCKWAVETALEIINNPHPEIDLPLAASAGLPNLGGAKMVAVFADHKANPELGKAEAERLITEENVVALVGCYNSAVTKPASYVAERYGIPFVCGASSSAALTERGLKYFFRIAVTDAMDAKHFFECLNELKEVKGYEIETFAVVYENTEFGQHAAEQTRYWGEHFGYKCVADVPYPFGATDVTSEVLRLKAANPDVVFHATLLSDYILFVRTYKELNYVPKAVFSFCGGFQDPKSIERLGADANYFCGSQIMPPELIPKIPVLNKVNELYKERAGADIDGVTLEIFEAVIVLADAINRAGTTDPEAVVEALRATNIVTDLNIGGGIRFDEKGQNILAKAAVTQVIDGEYRTVLPLSVATTEMIWPIPPWNER